MNTTSNSNSPFNHLLILTTRKLLELINEYRKYIKLINNTLLNNQEVTEEIKKAIKKHLKQITKTLLKTYKMQPKNC